jgi:hypothetical protein
VKDERDGFVSVTWIPHGQGQSVLIKRYSQRSRAFADVLKDVQHAGDVWAGGGKPKRKPATRRKAPARKSGGATKAQVEATFKSEVMPEILKSERGGYPDKPMRREAWNNWIDGLWKDGTITETQAGTWGHPKWLETYKGKR